jgi:uncharacterized protein YxeA
MKKVLSLLIALLFSFSLVAFAQETSPTDTGTSKVQKKSGSVKTKKPKKAKKTKKVKKSKKTKKANQESQQ